MGRFPELCLVCVAALAVLAVHAEDAHARHAKHRRHRHHHRQERVVGHYVVDDNTPTLGEVAVYLYGDAGMAPKIARWNHIKRPYRVWIGEKLALHRKPALKPSKGLAKLLAMWRQRFGLQERTSVASQAPRETRPPAPASLPPSETAAAPPETVPSPVPDPVQVVAESAEQLLDRGQGLFDQGKYEESLTLFRKAHALDGKLIPPWFFELRTLKALHRDGEAKVVATKFLAEHPEFAGTGLVDRYLSSQRSSSQ